MKQQIPYVRKSLLYYRPIWGWLIFCAFIGLSRMGLLLIEPQIVSLMVDRVMTPAMGGKPVENASIFYVLIKDIPPDDLWRIMAVLSAAFLLTLIFFFATFYLRWNLMHYVSLKVENSMRTEILGKINHIGTGILKKYTGGELITIANRDTSRIKDLYIATLPFILDNLFYLGMAALFISRIHVLLLIGPFVTFFAYLLITKGFLKKCDHYYNNMWKEDSALNTEAQESIYGIRTIKAYGAEKYRMDRFARQSHRLRNFYVDFGKTRFRYFLLYDAMDQILMVLTMAVSIWLATRMKMTNGEYSAFLGYLLTMANAFVDILFLLGDIQEFKVSGKRVFELLALEDPANERFGQEKVSRRPDITFVKVSVKADEKELLSDISVDIPYGKKVGVMGKTGSGKSVFLKTLQGFEDYDSGEITIDGRNSHVYDRSEIARACSYAMQDVFLFSNTIAANIEFYNPSGDRSKVENCGILAEVPEFVEQFPDGYDTVIGEKGFGLSGGQKQRVAIARALYKDAPVMVFDDCTSALDMETERKIFANLKKACSDKTMIFATHRAQALEDCDEILFFEDGTIAERGTFEELLKQNGRFAAIYYGQQIGMEV